MRKILLTFLGITMGLAIINGIAYYYLDFENLFDMLSTFKFGSSLYKDSLTNAIETLNSFSDLTQSAVYKEFYDKEFFDAIPVLGGIMQALGAIVNILWLIGDLIGIVCGFFVIAVSPLIDFIRLIFIWFNWTSSGYPLSSAFV